MDVLKTPEQRARLVETIFKAAYEELDTDDRDPVGPDGLPVYERMNEKLAELGLILSVEPTPAREMPPLELADGIVGLRSFNRSAHKR